jgi:hypothetical protein
MATYAVIDSNGIVINIIVAESTDNPPDGCRLELVPTNATWDGSKIITLEEYAAIQENLIPQEIQESGGSVVNGN